MSEKDEVLAFVKLRRFLYLHMQTQVRFDSYTPGYLTEDYVNYMRHADDRDLLR